MENGERKVIKAIIGNKSTRVDVEKWVRRLLQKVRQAVVLVMMIARVTVIGVVLLIIIKVTLIFASVIEQ